MLALTRWHPGPPKPNTALWFRAAQPWAHCARGPWGDRGVNSCHTAAAVSLTHLSAGIKESGFNSQVQSKDALQMLSATFQTSYIALLSLTVWPDFTFLCREWDWATPLYRKKMACNLRTYTSPQLPNTNNTWQPSHVMSTTTIFSPHISINPKTKPLIPRTKSSIFLYSQSCKLGQIGPTWVQSSPSRELPKIPRATTIAVKSWYKLCGGKTGKRTPFAIVHGTFFWLSINTSGIGTMVMLRTRHRSLNNTKILVSSED